MMGPRARATAAAVGAGLLVVAGAPPALADAPDGVGWWNSTNRGVDTPAPPDVPPGGLLVQGLSGDANGHQAIGGLRIALGGRNVEALVLAVDAMGPTGASVAACRADAAWEPTENGDWGARPAFDCSDAIAGEADADAGSLVFPGVGAFQEDGVLSVVLVPTSATRVVFGAPGEAAFYATEDPPPTTGDEADTAAPEPAPAAEPGPSATPAAPPRRAESPVVVAPGPPAPPVQEDQPAPAPIVAPEGDMGGQPLSSSPIELGSGLRRGTNAVPTGPGDAPARRLTALALLAVLGPYVARLSPGGGRLRPASVPWEKSG